MEGHFDGSTFYMMGVLYLVLMYRFRSSTKDVKVIGNILELPQQTVHLPLSTQTRVCK